MIINTGCRTDIPAFYSKWLMNRIREGYVLVRNPLCKYCYANANKGLVIENMKKHNENSPFLIGNSEVLNNKKLRGIEFNQYLFFGCIYQ